MQVLPRGPLQGPSISGRVQAFTVRSEVLGNERDLHVYLPPAYGRDPGRRYPVVYAQDGQNLFSADTAFHGQEWGLDETLESGIRAGRLPEMIVVGVGNRDRMSEYTPVPDPEHGGGNSAAYGRFLVDELKPWVDAHFQTAPGREKTAVMGSSLGGLVSLDLGWKYPDVFGLVAALSPSLWWGGRAMLEALATAPRPLPGPDRLYCDIGTRESPTDRDRNGVPDVVDHVRWLEGLLRDRHEGESRFVEIREGQHNEAHWRARAGDVLGWLVGGG